jgi:hypothetical protein
MNNERWGELIDRITSQFGVVDQGEEILDDVPNGKVEFVIFNSPMGKLMLERTTKPRVLGEKSLGGSKYGAGSRIEKQYSDTEMVYTVEAFKEVDGEWESFNAEGLLQ